MHPKKKLTSPSLPTPVDSLKHKNKRATIEQPTPDDSAANSNFISDKGKPSFTNPFIRIAHFLQVNPYWIAISLLTFTVFPFVWWLAFDVVPKWKPLPPMQGEFNIAIASFVVVNKDGKEVENQDGIKVAEFLFQRLTTHFDELGLQNIRYEIRSPRETGVIRGNNPQERAQAASELAQQINAHVLIYGVITDAGANSQFVPEFFVNYGGFQEADEILGPYALGNPLLIALPFDPTKVQDIDNPALSARANALSLLTIGLAYYSNDDFETALDYFSQARDTKGWMDGAGKEVIHILLGNTYVRLVSRDKDPSYLSAAHDSYAAALAIDPAYMRASLGQANVLYLEALGDPANPSFAALDQKKLDSAQALFEAALNEKNPPAGINLYPKVHFGLGQIYLVKAQTSQGDWQEKARKEFTAVVQEYEAGNNAIVYFASHSYARLGLMERQQGNVDSSATFYQKAINIASPYYKGYYYTRLGELYYANGDIELAIQAYEHAVQTAEFYGDQTHMAEYQKRLKELQTQKP
jgi:tetratricopeptide (TPR) repeat protein